MNCKEFESMVHEVVSRRTADHSGQLEALDHASHCLWCARRLDEESKLSERLQAFAGSLQSQRAPQRVETELLQAFRERNSREGKALWGPAWARLWRGLRWGLASGAAVAMAWMVIALWPRWHRSASAEPSRVAISRPAVDSGALPAGVAKSSSPPGRAQKGGATSQVLRAGNSKRAVLREPASEMTTDFLSLGTCDDSQCMEEATLVRVELPAEALLAFGLASGNEYPPEALVQAEVALGSNGVPFAIRFVN